MPFNKENYDEHIDEIHIKVTNDVRELVDKWKREGMPSSLTFFCNLCCALETILWNSDNEGEAFSILGLAIARASRMKKEMEEEECE